jgi:hypothetical protein
MLIMDLEISTRACDMRTRPCCIVELLDVVALISKAVHQNVISASNLSRRVQRLL